MIPEKEPLWLSSKDQEMERFVLQPGLTHTLNPSQIARLAGGPKWIQNAHPALDILGTSLLLADLSIQEEGSLNT